MIFLNDIHERVNYWELHFWQNTMPSQVLIVCPIKVYVISFDFYEDYMVAAVLQY